MVSDLEGKSVPVIPIMTRSRSPHILLLVSNLRGLVREVSVVRAQSGQASFPSFKMQGLPLPFVPKRTQNGASVHSRGGLG